jgi:hypothetical protein
MIRFGNKWGVCHLKIPKNALSMPSKLIQLVSYLILIVAQHILYFAYPVSFATPCLWPLARLGDPTIWDPPLCNYWIP